MEKKFKITVDGRKYIVTVEDISDGSSLLYPDAGSMKVPSTKPSTPISTSVSEPVTPSAGAGDETSPLAGIVSSIEVGIGQEIRKGDRVASVEAMKMKTPIVAHSSGRVSKIHVKVGDVIDAGQPLMTIG